MSGFDYCTIIGRDTKLWKWHVSNVLRNAGLPRDKWDFNVIIYYNDSISKDITGELIATCHENEVSYTLHKEDPSDSFIKRLYACWNKVYEIGQRDLVLRAGSDQAWYPNSFARILTEYENSLFSNTILQAQTIEAHGPSRHLVRDFGDKPDTFDEKKFIQFCEEIKKPGLFSAQESLDIWKHPTITIDGRLRTEGCSWLQDKELWQKHGPMPDYVMPGGITGDVWLNRKYQDAGIPDFLVGDCITYHLVRGESR